MGWTISVDETVVAAVLSSFCDTADVSMERLSAVKQRDWERAYPWLVASGMGLYLLEQLQRSQMEGCLPRAMTEMLRKNIVDNRRRNDVMMEEFIAINSAFLREGVTYCNVKGFTLSPCYCPDAALRSQLDFDLLIDAEDLELGRRILAGLGYTRTVASEAAWEFKAGPARLTRMEDHFKPGPHRSVELHFCPSVMIPHVLLHNEWPVRIEQRVWYGHSFPVLSPADQFLVQALHLFSHLRTAYTRLSWLLEYKRFVSANQGDSELWGRVREYSRPKHDAYIAIGLANLLSSRLFGNRVPAQLNEWTLDCLPAGVRLWADCYGQRAVLSRLPGTKLYLMLERELTGSKEEWRQMQRKRLLPLHGVPRIACRGPNETLRQRIRRELQQVRFAAFRIHFHLVEGLRYLVETRRWNRMRADLPRPDRQAEIGSHVRIEAES